MNALLASIAIERESGLETIPHVTPRDTSVMGLQSILLGAHADGIRNVLAVTGDPPEVGDYAGARGVYEVDSIGLTQILDRLNDGTDFNGREIDAPTSFFPGVAVNPTADDLDAELERFALQDRGRREVRDDPGAVRPDVPRADARAPRRHAARSRCSSASSTCAATSSRSACTTRCPGIVVPERDPGAVPRRRQRTRPQWGSRWRASSSRAPATWPPASTSSRRSGSRSQRSTCSRPSSCRSRPSACASAERAHDRRGRDAEAGARADLAPRRSSTRPAPAR